MITTIMKQTSILVLFAMLGFAQESGINRSESLAFGKSENAPKVMILGVYHFHNPGADYAKFGVADILSKEKQKEVSRVVEMLAKFRPTKIALEKRTSESEEINSQYRDFLIGKFTLTANEIYQLGFRIAESQGHKQLFMVDYPGGLEINSLMKYAKENDSAFFNRQSKSIDYFVEQMNQMQKTKSVLEILRAMNQPDALTFAQSLYVDMATVGRDEDYIGADVASDWYKRNLKIFANLARVSEPQDRILLIIGQGHKPILQQLVRESPRMQLVEVLDYLGR